MAILVIFWRFLWAEMAKLSLIDFKIGLPIILKVNDGQNKFELHISKNSAKIWGGGQPYFCTSHPQNC